MRMTGLQFCAAAAMLTVLFSGCEAPRPPDISEPAGPKTKEEVLAIVRPLVQPIRDTVRPPAGVMPPGVSDEQHEQIIGALRDAIIHYGDTPHGQQALRELGYEIEEFAKEARDLERWRLVRICVDAHEILNMRSETIMRLDARAQSMLAKPKIEVKGFMEDKEQNDYYVFLQLTDRSTGKRRTVTMREGEEVDDLRLVRIIGRNKGVRLEYLKIEGLFFDIEF